MAQAQHFEQGQNWRAKNAASIKLRAGDGRKHPVEVRAADEQLTEEQLADAAKRRDAERARIDAKREAAEAARRGAARERRADDRAAARSHTPAGWVPANQRNDYFDPMSRANDPRRLEGTAGASRKKSVRGRKPSGATAHPDGKRSA